MEVLYGYHIRFILQRTLRARFKPERYFEASGTRTQDLSAQHASEYHPRYIPLTRARTWGRDLAGLLGLHQLSVLQLSSRYGFKIKKLVSKYFLNPWLYGSFVSFFFSYVPGGRPSFLFNKFAFGRINFQKLRFVNRADLTVMH